MEWRTPEEHRRRGGRCDVAPPPEPTFPFSIPGEEPIRPLGDGGDRFVADCVDMNRPGEPPPHQRYIYCRCLIEVLQPRYPRLRASEVDGLGEEGQEVGRACARRAGIPLGR
jgi:hypothetical protein